MSYNLDENVSEYFEFQMGGGKYKMKYPTTEDVKEFQDKDESKVEKKLLSLIESVEGSPDFTVVYNKANVQTMRNFNKMMMKEIGGVSE